MDGLVVDEDVREKLKALRAAEGEEQSLRDRAEMVLLSLEGWSAPRIARFLGCHPATVRRLLRAFGEHGVGALHRRLPGPAPDRQRRTQVERALHALLGQPRSWTASQLSEALRQHHLRLGERQVRRYLAGMGEHWRRTKATLEHRQKPDQVMRARRELASLKKRPAPAE